MAATCIPAAQRTMAVAPCDAPQCSRAFAADGKLMGGRRGGSGLHRSASAGKLEWGGGQ